MGWTNPMILAGLVIGIIALIALVKIENKAAEPLIPMKLFKNKNYTVLLIVGFICYCYQHAMNHYAPIGAMPGYGSITRVQQVHCRCLVDCFTIILPTIAGAWVGKRSCQCVESNGNWYKVLQ